MYFVDTGDLERQIKSRLLQGINRTNTGQIVCDALLWTTRNHIQKRYPGSSHWDPKKVTSDGPGRDSGSITVAIPGAGRAYHDVDIFPIRAKALCFPIHSTSYGKRASDYSGLFRHGSNLARKYPQGIVDLFHLCKHVHQKQDPTLLPTDEELTENIMVRWFRSFEFNTGTL